MIPNGTSQSLSIFKVQFCSVIAFLHKFEASCLHRVDHLLISGYGNAVDFLGLATLEVGTNVIIDVPPEVKAGEPHRTLYLAPVTGRDAASLILVILALVPDFPVVLIQLAALDLAALIVVGQVKEVR